MTEVQNKRLLFLGGTGYFCSAIEMAKKMGIYTIVTDYFLNSPAKKLADKAYDISTTDIEKLKEIIVNEKVNGIFVGWSDINHYIAQELCDFFNMPFYATKEQLYKFTNKKAFKNMCIENNVPVVPEYSNANIDELDFPIVVKPVDSYGGKGITICHDTKECIEAINKALNFSKSKEYIIEKYMDENICDTIGVYYTIQNGCVALSSMTDRYMYEFNGSQRLNVAIFYPSVYLDRYIKEVDVLVRNMIKNNNIKNGTIFLEGCVDQTGFYFWESGFRLCGAQQNIFPAYFNGVDIQKKLIEYAVTGNISENNIELEDPFFKNKYACNGLIFLTIGTINNIEGIDKIKAMNNVINFTQLKQIGDTITEELIGTLNQSFARFHIVADTRIELYDIIKTILNELKVTDINNKNMILNNYDFKVIESKIGR